MTDQAAPALAGGEAQPVADVNSIDSIIDNAETNEPKAELEADAEQLTPEPADDPWPKKAENALAKAKGKAAQLRAERDQERTARQWLEQQLAQFNAPKTPTAKTAPDGSPKETDFSNYAEYIEARTEWRIEQALKSRDGKQAETQAAQQDQKWRTEREQAVATTAQQFIKDNPDAQSVMDEHSDIADDFSPQLQRLFLEADNAALAFYNLAKEGKLDSLATMSLAKAAMEIGRAQTQAAAKPKTKAPIPLSASRGSVPSGKSLDAMSGNELMDWLNT